MTHEPRGPGAHAWAGFAVVALLGIVDVAAGWSGVLGSAGALRASTGSVGMVYCLIGALAMGHTLAQRDLAPAFLDHALVTILLLTGAWDLLSPFAFGVADPGPILLHVLGGGGVVVLMGMLVALTLPRADAYARMVESVLKT